MPLFMHYRCPALPVHVQCDTNTSDKRLFTTPPLFYEFAIRN